MSRPYLREWLAFLACAAGAAAWIFFGKALVRRALSGPVPIPESARTESSFLAVLLPRVADPGGKFGMTPAALAAFLGGLKSRGFAPIGARDVADFYAKGRRLPPKAILLAVADDDPRRVARADAEIAAARWRAILFISGTAAADAGEEQPLLTAHALEQLRLGGGWEIGAIAGSASAANAPAALLDDGAGPPLPAPAVRGAPVFRASDSGENDGEDSPGALRILALRPDLSAREDADVVASAWPRAAAFSDDFAASGLGADWIQGWGTLSAGKRRLALMPTPRQSGAGVFLRGTEKWRDLVLEFDLLKFRKEFWAYARYAEDGSFVRVGARGGDWYLEQKRGGRSLPARLARAPILPGSLPARVSLVLKGDSAIVRVNGRLPFGRALRVDHAVRRGRVLLTVYDPRRRSAFAALTRVAARPADRDWIAWNGAGRGELDDDALARLRARAPVARALSPRWVAVAGDGSVAAAGTQRELIRSLAGFYGCRLVPTAQLPDSGTLWTRRADAARLTDGLDAAARDLDAAGLNLRLRAAALARPGTALFLAGLRARLRARRRELWLTVDGGGAVSPEVAAAVDGVLRPSGERFRAFEILQP